MKQENLIKDILRALYKEIGEDYDSMDKSSKDWFKDYYLDQKRQDEITEEMMKGKRLTNLRKNSIRFAVVMGQSPRGNK